MLLVKRFLGGVGGPFRQHRRLQESRYCGSARGFDPPGRGQMRRSQDDRSDPASLDDAGHVSSRCGAGGAVPQPGRQCGWCARRGSAAVCAEAVGRAGGAAGGKSTRGRGCWQAGIGCPACRPTREGPTRCRAGPHFLDGHRRPRLYRAGRIARFAGPVASKRAISLGKYPAGSARGAKPLAGAARGTFATACARGFAHDHMMFSTRITEAGML